MYAREQWEVTSETLAALFTAPYWQRFGFHTMSALRTVIIFLLAAHDTHI